MWLQGCLCPATSQRLQEYCLPGCLGTAGLTHSALCFLSAGKSCASQHCPTQPASDPCATCPTGRPSADPWLASCEAGRVSAAEHLPRCQPSAQGQSVMHRELNACFSLAGHCVGTVAWAVICIIIRGEIVLATAPGEALLASPMPPGPPGPWILGLGPVHPLILWCMLAKVLPGRIAFPEPLAPSLLLRL